MFAGISEICATERFLNEKQNRYKGKLKFSSRGHEEINKWREVITLLLKSVQKSHSTLARVPPYKLNDLFYIIFYQVCPSIAC